jgi:hypothetical protein
MSMFPIASYTVGAGGSYGVDLSSISQAYTHLQVRIFARSAGSIADHVRVSPLNDQTPANYRCHYLYGNGTSALSGSNQTTAGQIGFLTSGIPYSTSQSNTFATYIVDILDYTNTSKYKTVKAIGGWDDNNVSGTNANVSLSSYVWMNTAAITSVTIASVNNPMVQGTRIDLYGITSSGITGA